MQRGKNGNSNEGSNITCIMLEQVENADFELSKYRNTPRAEDARAFTKHKPTTAARVCAKI